MRQSRFSILNNIAQVEIVAYGEYYLHLQYLVLDIKYVKYKIFEIIVSLDEKLMIMILVAKVQEYF